MVYNIYMSDEFSFDEQRVVSTSSSAPRGMIGFLMDKCGVKTEAGANVILLVLSLLIFGLAISIFISAAE